MRGCLFLEIEGGSAAMVSGIRTWSHATPPESGLVGISPLHPGSHASLDFLARQPRFLFDHLIKRRGGIAACHMAVCHQLVVRICNPKAFAERYAATHS